MLAATKKILASAAKANYTRCQSMMATAKEARGTQIAATTESTVRSFNVCILITKAHFNVRLLLRSLQELTLATTTKA